MGRPPISTMGLGRTVVSSDDAGAETAGEDDRFHSCVRFLLVFRLCPVEAYLVMRTCISNKVSYGFSRLSRSESGVVVTPS